MAWGSASDSDLSVFLFRASDMVKTSLEPEEPGMFAEHGYKVELSCCLSLAESETRDVEGN